MPETAPRARPSARWADRVFPVACTTVFLALMATAVEAACLYWP